MGESTDTKYIRVISKFCSLNVYLFVSMFALMQFIETLFTLMLSFTSVSVLQLVLGCIYTFACSVLMRSEELVGRFDRDKWHTQLSPVLNTWKKLNQVETDTALRPR